MATLGKKKRNGTKSVPGRARQAKRPDPVLAKLAAARRAHREALEQNAATAEILKVIAASPSNTQPVFDAIARSAQKLLNAHYANVTQLIGDELHLAAYTGTETSVASLRQLFPARVTGQGALGKAVLGRAPNWVADVETDPAYSAAFRQGARERGYRSLLAVPMLRNQVAIGAIAVTRREPGPFTDHQISVLQTFADQAVIAIENVRLFNETKESLERQTATAEILKVIASSPTDAQPVFDVIVESAVRLCGARFGRVYRYDGSAIHMVASHGLSAPALGQVQRVYPRPAAQDTTVGQAILGLRPRFVHDVQRDQTVPPLSREMMEALGTRSQVTMPMLRAGGPIGAIVMGWDEARWLYRQAGRAAPNLRRPGRDRDRERAPVQRDQGGSRAADRDRGDPQGDQRLADRRQAGVRRDPEERCRALRCASSPQLFRSTAKLVHSAPRITGRAKRSNTSPGSIRRRRARSSSAGARSSAKTDRRDFGRRGRPALRSQSVITGHWRRMLGAPMLREGEPLGALVVAWREPGETPRAPGRRCCRPSPTRP